MATITSEIQGISGWQGLNSSCNQVGVYDLKNYVDKVFVAITAGSSFIVQNASVANSPFAAMKTFDCGNSYIFFRNKASSAAFNIDGFIMSNVSGNSLSRMTTLYPDSFVIEGKGTFHLTTGVNEPGVSGDAWYKGMPVYMTENRSSKIWYDGSQYVMSSVIGNKSGSVSNGSKLPNVAFGDHKSSSSTVVVSGFTGSSAGANDIYAHVGYLKTEKVYRSATTGKYFYFFNGSSWVLADQPFNITGNYVMRGSTLTGKVDNTSGSNGRGFDGQSGLVRDGGTDPRSLATEDSMNIMSTEDKVSGLITEENI